jgi:cytochrome c oxidase subunit 4
MAHDHTSSHGSTHGNASGHGSSHAAHAHHVVPLWLLTAVFVALLVLTYLTVAVTKVDGNQINIPSFNIIVALLIAVVKAVLVCLYFMHLRWDSPFNSLLVIGAILFVGLFIAFTIIDTSSYKKNFTPPGGFSPPTQIKPAAATADPAPATSEAH